jgi:hypothetical protein
VVDLECPRRAIRQKCSSRNDCISANCVTVDYMGLTRICLPCGALYACERGNNLSPCHWVVTIPAHAMTCAECPLLILFPHLASPWLSTRLHVGHHCGTRNASFVPGKRETNLGTH